MTTFVLFDASLVLFLLVYMLVHTPRFKFMELFRLCAACSESPSVPYAVPCPKALIYGLIPE